jgi:signal transduction histidine kinase
MATARTRLLVGRAVFVLLGSLLSVPYVAVVVWAAAIFRYAEANPIAPLFATGVAVGLFAVPAALRVTASLERTACDELLGTRLGGQPAPAALADVLRSALWFGMHLATGFLAAVLLAVLAPSAVVLGLGELSGRGSGVPALLEGVDERTTALLAVGGTLASAVLLAVAVVQMPRWAVLLLGPSAGQRIALAERAARAAAEGHTLARELHDSIGHALTVTTLQAAAARAQLHRDPHAADAALAAVEDTGRRAQADLDAALAVLREPRSPREGPQPGIDGLDGLLDSFRAAGLAIDTDIDPRLDLWTLPVPVSREAYRLVQEALTNVLRHGAEPRVSLRLRQGAGSLRLRAVNRAAPGPPGTARRIAPADQAALADRTAPADRAKLADRTLGGLGLTGLRERLTLLGGASRWGAAGPTGFSRVSSC